MVDVAFVAFAAIMSIVNLVALACIDYNLRRGYYKMLCVKDVK